jgi:hypothetical protein
MTCYDARFGNRAHDSYFEAALTTSLRIVARLVPFVVEEPDV